MSLIRFPCISSLRHFATLSFLLATVAHASPWAARVIAYDPGAAIGSPYTNPASALGSPTRYTGIGSFPGAVTPFNPAFGTNELVSIGAGGHLTLEFARPARDDPRNPFGIDLLVFGNAGFIDVNFPTGVAGPLFGASRGGIIEVSADGQDWRLVPGIEPDGLFPTLGYADLTSPYSLTRGTLKTSFTTPVDPVFDPSGRTFQEIVAAYNGSGGGTGIDLAATGLSRAAFIRFSMPVGTTGTAEIDAVAIVRPIPAPGAAALLCIAACMLRFRQRRDAR